MSMRVFLIGGMLIVLACLDPRTARCDSSAAELPVEAPKPAPLSVLRPVGGEPSIALIDMGYVFKNSTRFNARRKEIEEEIATANREANERAEHIKALQEALKKAEAGSPEQQSLNLELIKRTADYKALQLTETQEFTKREAELFRSLYLDVQELVETFARERDITLVIRFERGEISEIEDAAESLKRMNRQIVHYDPALDISDEILRQLNRLHASQKDDKKRSRRLLKDRIH